MNLVGRTASWLSLAVSMLVISCGGGGGTDGTDVAESSLAVTFRDRQIDLEPFLIGFPYSGHIADLEHGHLFYFERTPEGRHLYHQPLTTSGELDHAAGRRISDEDWSRRSFRGGRWHAPTGRLFFTGDEANDEHFNVYALDPASGAIEQITHNDYTYAWSFSDDQRYLAHLSRRGETEPFDTGLMVRDLETGEERQILRDNGGADRFTWSAIRFAPDNRSVVLTVQHDGQRNTKSLAQIDLEAKHPLLKYLHPPRVVRYSVSQVDGWLQEGVFLFRSAQEGFDNLYRYDMTSGRTRRLTNFREELGSVELLETEPPTVVAVLRRPHESVLLALDADSGRELTREAVSASVSLMDGHGRDLIVSQDSLETPWLARRLVIDRSGDDVRFGWSPFGGVDDALLAKISHYDVERVEFPTFDIGTDGETRMLHGFLLTPREPPKSDDQRLVRIKSFYGGSNRFDTQSQIMAAAGIATFSPAPRGSRGFGAEFAALNDGDLGGDEIVDVIYAARWLERERGYQPHQIGVYGASHGGYATMRSLTFPPSTNGRDAAFEFGFGWSHAGFSDILTFYDSCNIPDWVIKEAGHPVDEQAKLADRSPINHVERLAAPLLLTHGGNDWRVPPDESRRFHAAATELGKPVTYVEFEGQGHSIRGFDNLVRYYQAVLSFMEAL